jgi:hypothetical protein
LANYYIDYVLTVNHIESTRDNNSDGIIHIKYNDPTIEKLIWLNLPDDFIENIDISNYPITQPCKIHITLKKDSDDINYITTLKLKIKNQKILTAIILNLEKVNEILFRAGYSVIIGLADVYSIVQNEEIPFLGLNYDIIQEFYRKNKFALQRLGIMNTIEHYKPYL